MSSKNANRLFCISDGSNCPADFEAFGDNCYFIDFNVQVPYDDIDFYCTKEDENAYIITTLVAFPVCNVFSFETLFSTVSDNF